MDATRARDIANQINSKVNIANGAGWYGLDDTAYRAWGSALLARLAVLVGEQEMLYVTGWIEDDDRPEGSIAIFTPTELIRATFAVEHTDAGNGRLAAKVSAIDRKRITRVDVMDAGSLPESGNDAWPGRCNVDLTIEGEGDTLSLPLAKRVSPGYDSDLAAYVGKLLGRDLSI